MMGFNRFHQCVKQASTQASGGVLSDGNELEETVASSAAPNYLLAPVEVGRSFPERPSASP